jgi:hypothetical protein
MSAKKLLKMVPFYLMNLYLIIRSEIKRTFLQKLFILLGYSMLLFYFFV